MLHALRLRDLAVRAVTGVGLLPLARMPRRLNQALPHRAKKGRVPNVAAYGVYRKRNAAAVEQFVDALPRNWSCRLHALDDVDDTLESWTTSQGPGARMPLLQSLISSYPPDRDSAVLIFDDDVTFIHADPARFLEIAMQAGFDIAQPAHGVGSTRSFAHNRCAWLSTARRVGLVEVGPVVLFSPRALGHVLPFPSDSKMGWGLDVEWAGLRRKGLSLGVVDATPVVHSGTVATEYGVADEHAVLDRALAALGVGSVYDLAQGFRPTWRPWQAKPPWFAESDRATPLV